MEPSSNGSPELKSSLRPMVIVVGCRATVPWVWHPRAPCGVWRPSSGWRLSYTSQLTGAVGMDLHANLRGPSALRRGPQRGGPKAVPGTVLTALQWVLLGQKKLTVWEGSKCC